MKKLKEYRNLRQFNDTPEPFGKSTQKNKSDFVIQRHDARRLHFDFRIESGGVLKSWAVPKGMPLTTNNKRMAVQTEDHPLQYAKFHGTIPVGNYGAGEVTIWDKGTYENKTTKYKTLEEGIEKGHFVISLHGKYMNGTYGFSKTAQNWIVVKKKEFVSEDFPDSKKVTINRKQIEFTHLNKPIFKKLRKGDLLNYYEKVAHLMLPYIVQRPLSMYRFPDGAGKQGFFQKNVPSYFPKWIKHIAVPHTPHKDKTSAGKTSKTIYALCNDKASLLYIMNQVAVPHVWTSKVERLHYPDKMIFDLDPSSDKISYVHVVALNLKSVLEELGFTPYVMTTGGKGFHIHVPIKPENTHQEVREFSGKIAEVFAAHYPETTTEISKQKRAGRIFIDVNRNSWQQTAVAPYSVRDTASATIAMPLWWHELEVVDPQTFTIDTIDDRIRQDPWYDFFRKKVSLRKIRKKLLGT